MHNLFTSYFKDKETAEAEALDGRDEEDEDEAVAVENESYVNLRKKMVNKHNLKMDNLLQENGKLCREFQKKQVIHMMTKKQQRLVSDLFHTPSAEIYFKIFFNALLASSLLLPSHPGVSGPCWSRGGNCLLGKKKKIS